MVELTEFHRGWMIEVIRNDAGFRSICYSPVGERLSSCNYDRTCSAAWLAALDLVDRCFACDALSEVMRECFEAHRITFDELYEFNQSLGKLSLSGFIQTHFSS